MAEAISGQKTVATAGTPERLPATSSGSTFEVKALPGNTGNMFVGNDGNGSVSSTSGHVLEPGDMLVINVNDLSALWLDATSSGDGISWVRLD